MTVVVRRQVNVKATLEIEALSCSYLPSSSFDNDENSCIFMKAKYLNKKQDLSLSFEAEFNNFNKQILRRRIVFAPN